MKRTPTRLFRSILWIIAFMLVMLGSICFYDHVEKSRRYQDKFLSVQGSLNRLRVMYDSYREALDTNETKTQTQQRWTGFGLLKVHKAASTTTQAIFLRYGWTRNLTFVLPPEYNVFRYPNIISINESVTSYNILPPPPNKSFDILCHHVVYNKQAWEKILPKHSAKIATVREPFDHFRSTLNYFNPRSLKLIDTRNPVRTFLQNPALYESKNIRWSFTNNRMAFEFGVDPSIIENRDFPRFEKYLWDVLNKDFTVVLVAEKYDESLVLMRRRLNWELRDILYIAKNIRSGRYEDRYLITEDVKDLHQHFAIFEYLIYNFFDRRLEDEIAKEEGFIEEVLNFKKVVKSVSNYCRAVHRWPSAVLSIEKSPWSEEFTVSFEDCKLLYKQEIPFTQDIRKRQYGHSTWPWKQNHRDNFLLV